MFNECCTRCGRVLPSPGDVSYTKRSLYFLLLLNAFIHKSIMIYIPRNRNSYFWTLTLDCASHWPFPKLLYKNFSFYIIFWTLRYYLSLLPIGRVPGSIPSQGPRHTKDVIEMVPVVPLFSTEHSKGKILALSQELR